jgi:hypothetical protein
MEKKGEILHRNTGKRNRQIWCARIRGVSHVTPLLGNASNAAVMATVTRQLGFDEVKKKIKYHLGEYVLSFITIRSGTCFQG